MRTHENSDCTDTIVGPVRALFFEDQAADVELCVRALQSAGVKVSADRVATIAEALERFHSAPYDVILSDYNVQPENGIDLFRMLKTEGLAIPFILVTGSLGDERAVECLKEGMADYVLKDHLVRLPVAVRRALEEQRLRNEQASAVAAVRRSEASYRSFVDGAPFGIFRAELEKSRLIEVNPALVALLGYESAAELLEVDLDRQVFADPREAREVAETLMRAGRAKEIQVEWRRKDNGAVTVELNGRRLPDGNSETCAEVFVEDISERRRAEERIRQLNRLYSVLTHVNQAVSRVRERDQLLLDICRVAVEQGGFHLAWFGLLDHEAARIKPLAWWGAREALPDALSTGEDAAAGHPAVLAVKNGKPVISNRASDPGPSRSVGAFPVLVQGRPIGVISMDAAQPMLFDDESLALLDELAADASFALERMESESMRRRAEQELNEFFDLSQDLHCIAGTDGRIHRLNRAFEEALGFGAGELDAGILLELVHPSYRKRVAGVLEQLKAGLPVDKAEVRLRSVDGSYKCLLCSAALVPPLGLVLVAARDISDRKRLEEQLCQQNLVLQEQNRYVQLASRMKSEFLANMSHELRTPLNCIIGFSELAHDGRLGPVTKEQEEYLGRILSSGRHLLQLINGVLDLSKIEAGCIELHPESVSVDKLVEEVTASVSRMAMEKQIHVDTAVADLGPVTMDPVRFKQILYNYLSNAIKFSGEGSRVAVRVQPQGEDGIRLEVADKGIGIAEKDRGRLFVEFQQLDSGASKRFEGTGLGLALTRRIVEAQGGSVAVTSALGQGSTFSAVLPRFAIESMPRERLPGEKGADSENSDLDRGRQRGQPVACQSCFGE